jgi:hypothetical protein
VRKELVVKQEETRDAKALGWNKIEEYEKSFWGVIWEIGRGVHTSIYGHLLSRFFAYPGS